MVVSTTLTQLKKEDTERLLRTGIIKREQLIFLSEELTSGLAIASYSILLILTLVLGYIVHKKHVHEKIKDVLTIVLCMIWILLLIVSSFKMYVTVQKDKKGV